MYLTGRFQPLLSQRNRAQLISAEVEELSNQKLVRQYPMVVSSAKSFVVRSLADSVRLIPELHYWCQATYHVEVQEFF